MAGRHANPNEQLIKELQQAIAGIRKHLAGQTLQIDGKEMTAEEIIAAFEQQIELIRKTQVAEANWREAAKHKRELLAGLDDESLAALREVVRLQFGEDSEEYRQLVTTPRRRPGGGTQHVRGSKTKPAGADASSEPAQRATLDDSPPDDDDAN
jgi:hypothetical protein